jgi:hypothetical protein
MSTQPNLPGIPRAKPAAPLAKPRKKERTSGDDLSGPAVDPGGTLPMFRTARDIKKNFQPNPGDFAVNYGGAPKQSEKKLWEQKRNGGVVNNPVHLGVDAPSQEYKHWEQYRTQRQLGDKPMIYGGHHRIASMDKVNPDQFMPVMYHEAAPFSGKGEGTFPLDNARRGDWQMHYPKGYT